MLRRDFLKVLGVWMASGLISRTKAYALEQDDYLEFSPSVASELAAKFVYDNNPDSSFEFGNPINVYNPAGSLIGYEIALYKDNMPHGHVVFDATNPVFIPRFSFSQGDAGVRSSFGCSEEKTLFFDDTNAPKLLMRSPTDFSLLGDNTSLSQYGLPEAPSSSTQGSSKPTAEWRDLMIPVSTLYHDYTIGDVAYGREIGSLSESKIMSERHKYACGVSALYCIACMLPYPNDNPASWQRWLINSNDYQQYDLIWEDTKTSAIGETASGVTLGSTDYVNLGPGFSKFCQRQKRLISYLNNYLPSYETFKNAALEGKFALFGAGVNQADGRSGHIMAATGVAQAKTSVSDVYTPYINVYDGWNDRVFIRFDHPSYTDKFAALIYP